MRKKSLRNKTLKGVSGADPYAKPYVDISFQGMWLRSPYAFYKTHEHNPMLKLYNSVSDEWITSMIKKSPCQVCGKDSAFIATSKEQWGTGCKVWYVCSEDCFYYNFVEEVIDSNENVLAFS